MSDESKNIQKAYESGAGAYSKFWSAPFDFTAEDRQYFCELVAKNGKLLDVGCGPGNDAGYFSEKGFDVHGIDISDSMLKIAKERAPNAKFSRMNMSDLQFEDSAFHAIWSSFSFLHIKKDLAPTVLKEFRRVLKPAGYVFLAVHRHGETRWRNTEITGLKSGEGGRVNTYVQEWQPDELQSLLVSSDFEIIKSRAYEREGGLYPLLSLFAKRV